MVHERLIGSGSGSSCSMASLSDSGSTALAPSPSSIGVEGDEGDEGGRDTSTGALGSSDVRTGSRPGEGGVDADDPKENRSVVAFFHREEAGNEVFFSVDSDGGALTDRPRPSVMVDMPVPRLSHHLLPSFSTTPF